MIDNLTTLQDQNAQFKADFTELGKTLNAAFAEQFGLLNDRYVEAFNDSNERLEKVLGKMLAVSALLSIQQGQSEQGDD